MTRLPITTRMTYSQMRYAVDSLPVTITSRVLPENICGLYDAETNLILIDPRMTYAQKRSTLVHELVHWAHGDTGCNPLSSGKEETRARRETARILIDREQYAEAEVLYDGDAYAIACDLDVTVQTVQDYKTLLHGCRPYPFSLKS